MNIRDTDLLLLEEVLLGVDFDFWDLIPILVVESISNPRHIHMSNQVTIHGEDQIEEI